MRLAVDRRGTRFVAFATLGALLCCLPAAPAVSQSNRQSRDIVMRVHTNHAEMQLVYHEPPGAKADRILSIYDSNNDGKIDPTESLVAKRPMLRRAHRGISISYSGAMAAEKDRQIRFQRDDQGGLSMRTSQRIDFVTKDGDFSVDISLARAKDAPNTVVKMVAAEDWLFEDGTTEQTRTLEGGSTERFFLERIEYAQPKDRGDRRDWAPPESSRP